jgi:hypothetical protein
MREFPELARIPWQLTGVPIAAGNLRVSMQPYVHKFRRGLRKATFGLLSAPTRSFTDCADWMRTSLRSWVEGVVMDKRTLERGYFNNDYLRQMVQSHMSGERNYGEQISAVITFELFHRLFVD